MAPVMYGGNLADRKRSILLGEGTDIKVNTYSNPEVGYSHMHARKRKFIGLLVAVPMQAVDRGTLYSSEQAMCSEDESDNYELSA